MVKLRLFKEEDAEAYLAIANDENEDFYPFSYCIDLEDAKQIMDVYMNSDLESYAIEQDGILIGAVYIEYKIANLVQVSYFIGEPYRRKGYVKEALIQLESVLKKKRTIKTLEFLIHPKNKPSIRTAASFGATLFCKKDSMNFQHWRKKIK